MNQSEKFLKELNRRIASLEKQLQEADAKVKRSLDGDAGTIMRFGLAKEAEQITVLYGKLEELYNMKEAFEHIYEV